MSLDSEYDGIALTAVQDHQARLRLWRTDFYRDMVTEDEYLHRSELASEGSSVPFENLTEIRIFGDLSEENVAILHEVIGRVQRIHVSMAGSGTIKAIARCLTPRTHLELTACVLDPAMVELAPIQLSHLHLAHCVIGTDKLLFKPVSISLTLPQDPEPLRRICCKVVRVFFNCSYNPLTPPHLLALPLREDCWGLHINHGILSVEILIECLSTRVREIGFHECRLSPAGGTASEVGLNNAVQELRLNVDGVGARLCEPLIRALPKLTSIELPRLKFSKGLAKILDGMSELNSLNIYMVDFKWASGYPPVRFSGAVYASPRHKRFKAQLRRLFPNAKLYYLL